MADISQLVISVDSKGVVTATGNLELLNKSGKKTEKTTETLDQSVKKLTKQFERQARNAGKSANEIKILDLKAKGATNTQLKAAQAAMKNAEAMKKQADAARFAAQSAGATGGPFRAMRGSMQQVSWQLQDVAVQAQMGTSAFTILGQQGPQLASIFGPGGAVLGAVIAFGAMLGGVLFSSLTATKDAVKDLDNAMDSLKDRFDELGPAARAYQIVLSNLEIKKQKQIELDKAAELARMDEMQVTGLLTTVIRGLTRDLDEEQKTRLRLKAEIEESQQIQKNEQKIIDGISTSTEDLIKRLKEEKDAIGANSVVLAYQEGVRAGANDEQLRTIVLLAAQNQATKENIETTEENNKAVDKAKEQQQEYNANLQHQLKLLTETGPALDAYKARVKGGTEEQQKANAELERQIRTTKEKIKADADAAKAKAKADADAAKDKQRAESAALKRGDEAQKLMQDIELANMTELEVLKAHLTTKGGLLLEFLQEDHINLDQYLAMDAELQKTYDLARIQANKDTNDKIKADDQALFDAKTTLQNMVLNSASNVANGLAAVAEEGSKEAKVLFAMQKALAIAQIIVSTEVAAKAAAAQAAILGGPVAWYATDTMIRALGYASAGIVAGTAIAGGRALGGQVRGGESYLVGERGPELLTMGTSGRVTSNDSLKNAINSDNSNTSNVVNVNFAVQANDTAGFDRLLESRRGQIVNMINQAVNNRGRSSIV
jgi:hypothetical protein